MDYETPLRICLVDGPFRPFLISRGHEVLHLAPPQGVHDIAALLAKHGFTPDILLHTETLGRKVILRGVENLSCQTAFWSVDTHVNSHWQVHYAALFDAAFTTQKHLAPLFARGGREAFWLPWFGTARPFRPFAGRGTEVGFVGRMGEGRPVREQFATLLRRRFDARLASELSFTAMQDFYDDTRLAPNEALFGELNFRLFEAVSSGSLCFTPRTPGLGDLFCDGREVVGYDNGCELAQRLRFYQGHPDLAQALARAGHAALAARHLAEHRGEAWLAALPEAPGRARGDAARLSFALALLGLFETGLFGGLVPEVEADLARLSTDTAAAGGLVRLWRLGGRRDRMLTLCAGMAANRIDDPLLLATAAMAALSAGAFPLARALARGKVRPFAGAGQGGDPRRAVDSPRDICLFAAGIFREAGRVVRPGLVFEADRLVPQTVVEALIVAHTLDERDTGILVALDAALEPFRGTEPTRLGILSSLSLQSGRNWRWPLRLALVNARMFRLDEAAQELALARTLAEEAGEGKRFAAMRDRLFPEAVPEM
ncbi:glycosyltransferase family 1 protein [Desulfovibrio sulfodismutans]|uniref:Glycosyltransferase family 1 protein n=1 Tax=Desulfolutivibrio sulfodismutans TaxID=63561 RepID=A0A7K3NM87_9BACT|nr:glycosyltransferase [Desulfolutivibrio sulfodismutans]NDY57314.1 glycosyltransferase family 1 protein [Desulfolutivibrio sulfodismutans]